MTNGDESQRGNAGGPLFGVVLAAGRAQRYGALKQVAMYRGQTLVARAVGATAAVCGPRTVLVTGHEARAVRRACAPLPGYFVHNDEHATGLASSMASGIRAVRHVAAAILITLADQPLIGRTHLAALADTWRADPDRMVATAYAGVAGVPAVFPARVFDRLLSLRGDKGARELLADPGERLTTLACEAAAVDIDRPQDLEGL